MFGPISWCSGWAWSLFLYLFQNEASFGLCCKASYRILFEVLKQCIFVLFHMSLVLVLSESTHVPLHGTGCSLEQRRQYFLHSEHHDLSEKASTFLGSDDGCFGASKTTWPGRSAMRLRNRAREPHRLEGRRMATLVWCWLTQPSQWPSYTQSHWFLLDF